MLGRSPLPTPADGAGHSIRRRSPMPPTAPGAERAATEIVLKTVAPREPPHLLARPRLGAGDAALAGCRAVLVQAPAGFGKTSLLAQWRREHLSRGTAVAWLSADERDDPRRFLLALVQAVRTACARPTFARTLTDGPATPARELEGVTGWLAEIAQFSLDVLLIVDEAERLPDAGRRALTYVLHNAPQNLRIVVAARHGFDAHAGDLIAYGQCRLIGADALRFRLDETIALVGARVDADTCARLFELCDGWPLGLQLALAAMERAPDLRLSVEPAAAVPGALRDRLVDALIAKLAPDDERFLTGISIADMLHPALCRALTGDAHAPERLARLLRETPMFTASDDGPWCRLHTLVRDVLRMRLAQWRDDERNRLHDRASAWLAAHGMIEEAARHAHAAGRHQAAFELAERCLHDAVKQGHLQAMLDWLELLPEAELERRPRLRLAAAWALALGERHPEAARQVEQVLANPGASVELRYECALILSAAAYYADDPDRFVALFEPWARAAPVGTPWLAQVHANRLGARAILLGEPAQARRFQSAAPRADCRGEHGYVVRWGEYMTGMSYLCEGQLHLAEEVLFPALASAEIDLGRRHPLTCMLAALCATLAYEADRIEQAAALVANRLDVLERGGTPETVALAYRTAARVAAARGAEHRALDLLESLHALGVARRLPRLCVASLAEQARMHAVYYRAQTCEALVQRIDDIMRREAPRRGPLWCRSAALAQASAHAAASVAARRWPQALDALAQAGGLACEMKLGRERIESMALRAFALEQTGADGRALLAEAMDLARTFHLTRTLADAHPAVADWARRALDQASVAGGGARAAPRVVRPAQRPKAGSPRAVPSVVLTPKEREILELLGRNLSNKEIALAMTVGEETVKWHLKNLFGKLDASSRKHAVRRALVLGLLESAE
ncbi:LuxR family transcriptional regulator [Burkholderia mallei]|uniref:Transcriptional regulator, LuxR family n=4 Tax=Burkholderia mallei TaxID=13373 RepID=A2RZN0_BURM9|nr:LuxR C-terminal-related transcriptional regulator [Burkholderia mallei]AAU45465.1 transcriptional regulator, LuxR family [Burkholderia mallei ATCC 23344]ABM49010.1 transcriptional regulator, LuxR family [Burkholderia mallei SAVP1]ABM99117.2 transcriptional regulator, LuxR family [Burkholderia mallei NCTC 10229]ABO03260.1 transcriptional regulator, LuxR family [Burkholderia mallei NCTC 10247]AIW47622.1 LuxR family transcriptional regulator [Burkholderia mallei]